MSPWQRKQVPTSTGRIFASKKSSRSSARAAGMTVAHRPAISVTRKPTEVEMTQPLRFGLGSWNTRIRR